MPASVTRRGFFSLAGAAMAFALAGCEASEPQSDGTQPAETQSGEQPQETIQEGEGMSAWTLDEGDTTHRGFRVDDVLHAGDHGDIHFSIHVPDGYDGSTPYALYVALPGWEGLLFQGVGANLQEDFPFVANDYVSDMIVATPQLEDWGETSADQTVALTRWLLSAYAIDPSRVVLSGCSGGGETASLVVAQAPGLYAAVLHCISRWDGDIGPVVSARLPVYMAIGEQDDYYGPDYDRATYQQFVDAYAQEGLSEGEISDLVTLDVKPTSYFGETGEQYGQHAGGGALFPHDEQIMGWLFSHA
ncbi:MAG: prolyl oligopeptidase family serine peptidase [Tractidigestivibacter sp.]|uniref:prolyl oligopeptidase family serine peptidase n=1 Tax=Tractidigestivibacter sp. TaxID=2847320 RepID=UPI003D8F1F79